MIDLPAARSLQQHYTAVLIEVLVSFIPVCVDTETFFKIHRQIPYPVFIIILVF